MGTIVLKYVDLKRRTFPVPDTSPLVFNLFDEPTEINEIINNTSAQYYVRLFTDEWYININPNATFNLELENDYMNQKAIFIDKNFIAVKSKMFTHGIARKTIVGLKYNEMIFYSDVPYTRANKIESSVTFGEYIINDWYSDFAINYSEENIKDETDNNKLVNSFLNEVKTIFQYLLEKEQECTNTINDKKQQISKCEEKNTKQKEKPDPKSSNIWWTILYLIIILNVTYLIFGSIPYIVVTLVIGTFMLEMQYGDGFSRVFMYIFYLLLPTMITLFIIKSVFGISGSPDENNPYNRRYNLL